MQSLNKTLQGLMRGQNITNNIQQTMKQVYSDKDVHAFLNENRDRLSKEAIKRGQSKLYEYFHEKQLIEKGVPTVAPGYSPQLIISAGQIDVTYVPTKQLIERQRQQHIQRLVNSINMPKFIKNASYDDYYLNDDMQLIHGQRQFRLQWTLQIIMKRINFSRASTFMVSLAELQPRQR